MVVLEEALVPAFLHAILQEAADMLLQEDFGLIVETVRKGLGISHAERVDVLNEGGRELEIICPYKERYYPLSSHEPVNLSFHTALGTLEKVMTPWMVSLRVAHVVEKSTRFGFKDMMPEERIQTGDRRGYSYVLCNISTLHLAYKFEDPTLHTH